MTSANEQKTRAVSDLEQSIEAAHAAHIKAYENVRQQRDALLAMNSELDQEAQKKRNEALDGSRALLRWERNKRYATKGPERRLGIKEHLRDQREHLHRLITASDDDRFLSASLERESFDVFKAISADDVACPKKTDTKEVRVLSPWQQATVRLFEKRPDFSALCFGMPGMGKTAIMLEIMALVSLEALSRSPQQPPALILIYLHSVEQVREFKEHWKHFHTETAKKLREASIDLHPGKSPTDKPMGLSFEIRKSSQEPAAVHILVIPIDKELRFEKHGNYHIDQGLPSPDRLCLVLVDEFQKGNVSRGRYGTFDRGDNQGATHKASRFHFLIQNLKKQLERSESGEGRPLRIGFFSGTPLSYKEGFARFLSDILALLTWRRRKKILDVLHPLKTLAGLHKDARVVDAPPISKQSMELFEQIWSDANFQVWKKAGSSSARPSPTQEQTYNRRLLEDFFVPHGQKFSWNKPALQWLHKLLAKGQLTVLHQEFRGNPRVISVPGWQFKCPLQEGAADLDSEPSAQDAVLPLEFDLQHKSFHVREPVPASAKRVLVYVPPLAWAFDKVSDLIRYAGQSEPPKWLAARALLEANLKSGHFLLFPEQRQKSRAPEEFYEWLTSSPSKFVKSTEFMEEAAATTVPVFLLSAASRETIIENFNALRRQGRAAICIGNSGTIEGLTLDILMTHIMSPELVRQAEARGRRYCLNQGAVSTTFVYVEDSRVIKGPLRKQRRKKQADQDSDDKVYRYTPCTRKMGRCCIQTDEGKWNLNCVKLRNELKKASEELGMNLRPEDLQSGTVVELVDDFLGYVAVDCALNKRLGSKGGPCLHDDHHQRPASPYAVQFVQKYVTGLNQVTRQLTERGEINEKILKLLSLPKFPEYLIELSKVDGTSVFPLPANEMFQEALDILRRVLDKTKNLGEIAASLNFDPPDKPATGKRFDEKRVKRAASWNKKIGPTWWTLETPEVMLAKQFLFEMIQSGLQAEVAGDTHTRFQVLSERPLHKGDKASRRSMAESSLWLAQHVREANKEGWKPLLFPPTTNKKEENARFRLLWNYTMTAFRESLPGEVLLEAHAHAFCMLLAFAQRKSCFPETEPSSVFEFLL